MSKHTPGPWDIINQYIIAADESVICQWESYTDEANAVLIAAAPDLLAALRDVAQFLHFTPVDETYATDKDRLLTWVRAAIAKAEGTS